MAKRTRLHRDFPVPRERSADRFVAYIRVPSDEQAEWDLSLPAQLKAIQEYAARYGLVIVETFKDIESAKDPGRTQFTAMMGRLKRDGSLAGVVAHKVDRLTRNFKDYALVDDFKQVGVQFRFVHGDFDDSPPGRLGLGISIPFARHSIDNLSQETKKGIHERMLHKRIWSFLAPLGYLNKDGQVIPDPQTFPTLREAWHRYASGAYSLDQVAAWLYRQGVRTKRMTQTPALQAIATSTLERVFNNPFYYGAMLFLGQLIPGTHEPMVTKITFDQVQKIMRSRGSVRRRTLEFRYRGFLVCGECGQAITAEFKKGRYTYYRCTKSGGPGSCRQRFIREEVLERQILAQLQAIQIPEWVYDLLKEPLKEFQTQQKEFRDTAVATLRQRQDELQRRLDRLLELVMDKTITPELYGARSTELQNEKVEVLAELDAHERANDQIVTEMEHFILFSRKMADLFANGGPEDKKAILNIVASNSTLNGGKARLNLKPAFALLEKSSAVPYGVTDGIRTRDRLSLRKAPRQVARLVQPVRPRRAAAQATATSAASAALASSRARLTVTLRPFVASAIAASR